MRHVNPQRHRLLFGLGIGLIAVNMPLGWIGLLVFAALAAARREPRWIWAGIGVYAASWALLGLGVLIAGHTGVVRAREILHRRRRLRELLHLRRRRREARDAACPADEASP